MHHPVRISQLYPPGGVNLRLQGTKSIQRRRRFRKTVHLCGALQGAMGRAFTSDGVPKAQNLHQWYVGRRSMDAIGRSPNKQSKKLLVASLLLVAMPGAPFVAS